MLGLGKTKNKSKKQRKFQSSFRTRTWPSYLHISIRKYSLFVRSPMREEKPSFHSIWKGDGEPMIRDSELQELASPGCSKKWEPWSQTDPELLRNSTSISKCITMFSNQIHLNFLKKNLCHASHIRGHVCQRNQAKNSESLEWTAFLERGESCTRLLKRHLAGTGIFLATH